MSVTFVTFHFNVYSITTLFSFSSTFIERFPELGGNFAFNYISQQEKIYFQRIRSPCKTWVLSPVRTISNEHFISEHLKRCMWLTDKRNLHLFFSLLKRCALCPFDRIRGSLILLSKIQNQLMYVLGIQGITYGSAKQSRKVVVDI